MEHVPSEPPGVSGALLAAAVLAAAATAAGARPAAAQRWAHVSIRDSAGVPIVRNGAGGAWRAGDAWRLSDRPLLDVGSVDGPPATRLHRVRDAVRLSDGRVVVADAGSGEIRYFGDDGRPVRRAAGAGGGPAEFTPFAGGATGLSAIGRLPGDTVAAFDLVAGDVVVFGPEGGFVRSVPLEAPDRGSPGRVRAVGWTGDGTLAALTIGGYGDVGLGASIRRGTSVLYFFGPDGRVSAAGREYAGDEMYSSIRRGEEDGQFTVTSVSVDPFLRTLAADVGDGRVAVGSTDVYRVDLYGPDGRLRRVVRGPGGARPLDEGTVEAWLEEKLADAEDPAARKRYRRAADPSVLPDSLPAFESLLVDRGGRLWVREYRPPGARGPARWSVYDRRGRRLGEVEMPAALEPFEIGEGYVLGLWRDELGVEHVRMYGLRKPSRGR